MFVFGQLQTVNGLKINDTVSLSNFYFSADTLYMLFNDSIKFRMIPIDTVSSSIEQEVDGVFANVEFDRTWIADDRLNLVAIKEDEETVA